MKYRQGVYLFIIKNGKYLLVHNKDNPQVQYYFAGGGLEEGESNIDAFYREAKEELNLENNDFSEVIDTGIVHQHPWPKELQESKGFLGQQKSFIIAHLSSNKELDFSNVDELDSAIWVTRDELLDNLPFEDMKIDAKKVLDVYSKY